MRGIYLDPLCPRNRIYFHLSSLQVYFYLLYHLGNGEIDFDEFLMMMSKRMNETDHESEVKEAFEIFDREKSGYISHADLKHVMAQLGEKLTDEEVSEMLKEADTKERGKITWEGKFV